MNEITTKQKRGRKKRVVNPEMVERYSQIITLYLENYTLHETGERFGISRERVRQILNEHGIKPREWTPVIKPLKPRKRLTSRERFWSYVDKSGGEDACWKWIGGINSVSGYGHFSASKIFNNEQSAHRVAYRLGHKKKPKLWVLHTCDNPPCCNPSHLYEGTPKQNVQDRTDRHRSAHQRDYDGWLKKMKEGKAKNQLGIIKAVREQFAEGKTKTEIAKDLSLNWMKVHHIVTGKTFSYVE